ncbi:glycosyltransferase family 4 protein [Geminisphaera colitermitum]|uniref:glycosyltransferase family 4 protein n=1 Tax=Geminisphaera colitermitum TaxID=1148786 RepID=UPI0001965011|nr:glycosyltransferase family 4 protein [Geminisphaera colitermitum]
MNIGLLTPYFALGTDNNSGIGRHYRILADALVEQGHTVHVVYPASNVESARAATTAYIALSPRWTCDILPPPAPSWLLRLLRRSWPAQVMLSRIWSAHAASRALAAAASRLSLDIIEAHAYGAPALFYLRRRRRPRVVTRVSTTSRQIDTIMSIHSRVLGWQQSLERYATDRSDALVTHTCEHRDTLCAEEGFAATRFAIVAHGIPDPGPPPAFAPVNPCGHVEFFYLGRFELRKGTDVLFAALPAVAAACPNAIFTLAGFTGVNHEWTALQARHPALARSRVQVLGPVSDEELATLYRRCSVFVAPSRYESFGLIYAEAMSHAKPVIGCNAGGIPEVITDGVTGLLARPGDIASLTDSMIRLGSDAALRQRMGEAARLDFLARFNAATMAANSVRLYQKVAASR